jgi:hypothetical protein
MNERLQNCDGPERAFRTSLPSQTLVHQRGAARFQMNRIPKPIYMTADEIDRRAEQRTADARALPDGPARQAILKEIAQLRMYAEAKRWTESPGLKAGA